MHVHYGYGLLLALLTLPSNTTPEVSLVKKKITVVPTSLEQKKTPVPLEQKKVSATKKITSKKITNTITKKDIGYSYLFAKRYPEKFTISVNNKELKTGESATITDTDTFEVTYSYEWWAPWQTYKGTGTKKYRIPASVDEVKITFTDWHKGRITVANAELLEEDRTFADSKKETGKHSRKRHGK